MFEGDGNDVLTVPAATNILNGGTGKNNVRRGGWFRRLQQRHVASRRATEGDQLAFRWSFVLTGQ
jgi:hypothetical protein